jgi:RHS repeat-associated protein
MTTSNQFDKLNPLTGISSASSASQQWEYPREQIGTNNNSTPQWVGINVTAPGETMISGDVFLAQTPETNFTYDLDGNLTSDGRFNYTWDSENRLIAMVSLPNAPVASQYSNVFAYDSMGRRIEKIVATNSGSGWVVCSTNAYVYDGWNLAAVLDAPIYYPGQTRATNKLLYTFTWGTDLSGTMQGGGGVGGLLSMTVVAGPNAGTYFFCYDGNGNVVALVNAANGAVAANYEYGPFGELIRATGPLAFANPFLFSTKFYDWETGLYYYGYRYYNPSTGRWLSRDPIEERGGRNLCSFVSNLPVNSWDLLGLLTPVDVLNCYFGNSPERLWVMEQNDEYTKRMREWVAVQQALDKAKKDLSANCDKWQSSHMATPKWYPSPTPEFSPDKASFRIAVPSPAGTGPGDSIKDYALYKTTGHIDDNLWYSAVGSFTLCVTVDQIDCCGKKAKLDVWIYNPMTQQSFGPFKDLYPFGNQAGQFMRWHWTEDYNFGMNSGTGSDSHGGSSKGGGWGWWW